LVQNHFSIINNPPYDCDASSINEDGEDVFVILPTSFEAEQNYPNPFNPSMTIRFSAPIEGNYNLTVYNILGRELQSIDKLVKKPGFYEFLINEHITSNWPSGLYLYRLSDGNSTVSKKMLLIK